MIIVGSLNRTCFAISLGGLTCALQFGHCTGCFFGHWSTSTTELSVIRRRIIQSSYVVYVSASLLLLGSGSWGVSTLDLVGRLAVEDLFGMNPRVNRGGVWKSLVSISLHGSVD